MTIILSNNYYWNQFLEIIGNYCPRKQAACGEKEETSLYKIILCSYLRKNRIKEMLFMVLLIVYVLSKLWFFCDDVEFQVYAVSERHRWRQDAFEIGNKKRNNEFIRKMKKKCIGTQLCGPQTCVPMFLFVILSFLSFSLRRELRGNACLLEF